MNIGLPMIGRARLPRNETGRRESVMTHGRYCERSLSIARPRSGYGFQYTDAAATTVKKSDASNAATAKKRRNRGLFPLALALQSSCPQ
ncbi:hypothetical protein TMPK1_40870 [Rhodospirillales bacterium TMPK1]|uniref:Uncharacterized protein n=1 Tax=Roseiterribacter gracilis TaxID=2812848 RepID=A0A8S8XM49_9PROT|nr:hypothetical protein TMPK1_40870 [Rhodospirillales bacterium TMPK1]